MELSERKIRKIAAQLIKVYENVPTINCGGCGRFAMHLHKKLKEHGIASKIYVVSSNKYSSSNIKDELNSDYAWMHMIVKVGRTFVDATGIYGKTWKEAIEHSRKIYGISQDKLTRIPEQHMEYLVRNITWNPWYNLENEPKVQGIMHGIIESNLAPRESSARASWNNSDSVFAAEARNNPCASVIRR